MDIKFDSEHNNLNFYPETLYEAFLLGRVTACLKHKVGEISTSEKIIWGSTCINIDRILEFLADL